MPKSDAHVPGMNAVTFVAYCAQLAGLPRADAMRRAHQVLFYVGLGEARYRNLDTYSIGMRQRIKLAQALVHDPDLLLLDESTNGLDPQGREEMLELIRDLAHNKGINLIVSSHLLPDVEATCGHVVVLHRGVVVAEGPIDALKGERREAFEVRVKGDVERFTRSLRDADVECHDTGEDVMRVLIGERLAVPAICSPLRRVATCRCGTPAPERAHARRRVRKGHRGAVVVPIHDQTYRRYAGTQSAPGKPWSVIAVTGLRVC